jgi:menaquinol-cytochrome c reductase iron-sulfur subunit
MNNCNKEPQIMPDWKKVFVSREEFLKLICLTFGGLIALVASIPGVAFILNYFAVPEHHDWITIGPVEKFEAGQTVDITFKDPTSLPWDGVSSLRAAWLRREVDDNFLAFAVNCTHLGCPVRWEAGAELFLCPCHGGVYYSDGDVAGGPPPRPLHQYPVRIKNGLVEINVGPVLTEG